MGVYHRHMDLNPAQYDAVHTLSGPLLVLAGAGTGKTRVVTYRIAELIGNRIRPERILAVTFTNKAADEMQQRHGRPAGQEARSSGRKCPPSTRSASASCAATSASWAIRPTSPSTTGAIRRAWPAPSCARSRWPTGCCGPATCSTSSAAGRSASVRPEEAAALAQTDKEHLAAAAYRRYQNALKTAGAVDFDDLLLVTEELFAKFPKARQAEADRFDHLLVDEYQDTNASQYRIVKALAAGHRNLCVVGDDDQSIYGWRGAEVAHILRFKNDWPEAKVVRLEVNYRSTHEIVDWANRLIAFNKLRHAKTLRATCRGEPPRILQLEGRDQGSQRRSSAKSPARIAEKKRQPKDFAILCRTNEQPRAFEMELRQAKIPYVSGGRHVVLRSQGGPRHSGLPETAGQSGRRGVVAADHQRARPRHQPGHRQAADGGGRRARQADMGNACRTAKRTGPICARHCRQWPFAADWTAPFRRPAASKRSAVSRAGRTVPPALEGAVAAGSGQDADPRSGLQGRTGPPISRRRRSGTRWASVEEVVNAVAGYTQRETDAARPTMAGFLQEVALTGNEADQDKESKLERNAVALMTLHAAKGLEFPEVYMVGMEEGTLPHHRSIAERRRGRAIEERPACCYVRACNAAAAAQRLTLTLALNRRKWGKSRAHPSQPLPLRTDRPGRQSKLSGGQAGPQAAGHGGKTGHSPRSSLKM